MPTNTQVLHHKRASRSGFASILVGLKKNPHICESKGPFAETITRDNVMAVAAPADGPGVIPSR